MYPKEDRVIGPPKGVPQVLYDQVETLRWIRSVVGESKSWPDGKLRELFLQHVGSLLDGTPLPSLTEVEDLKKKLVTSEEQVKLLRLQLQSRVPTQQVAPQVEYITLPCGFMKHPWACSILFLLGWIVGYIWKTIS